MKFPKKEFSADGNERKWYPFAAIVIIVSAILIGPFVYFNAEYLNDKSMCDIAIKSTLKAPSTYKSISYKNIAGYYDVEYDAENSFGVPIRGRGLCTIENGVAKWIETVNY